MTALVHKSSILLPRKICPYSASGWADGCAGAPSGRPQYPALLGGYGPHRPPWNVAGVDYRVGVPDGIALTDWRTLSDPQLSVNTTTGLVRVDGISGGSNTFRNVDFSLGIGATLYNGPAGGAASFSCINCKFGLPPVGSQRSGSVAVHDQSGADLKCINCTFDGANFGVDQPSIIVAPGNVTLQYNWFIKCNQHVLEHNPQSLTKTVIYKYNFIDDPNISTGSHENFLQSGANNSTVNYDVSFNTTYQRRLGGAEGFQFYTNGTALTLPNPVFTNNVMIARPATPSGTLGPETMSYIVHGTTSGQITGSGANMNNYFDISGAFGAYYPATMTTSLGWSNAGNVDMNTGAIITPT